MTRCYMLNPRFLLQSFLTPTYCKNPIIRRTKEVFWMGFIASWAGQVPAVLFMTKYWRNDLVGLYTGMAIGYIILAILYSILVLRR